MEVLSSEHRFKSPLSRVWRALSDTNRINAAAGLPPVTYRDEPQADGTTRRFCSAAIGDLELEYEERPFHWVYEQLFEVERIYEKGPVKRMLQRFTFRPLDPASDGRGTAVELALFWDPADSVDGEFARMAVQMAAAPLAELFESIDRELLKEGTAATPPAGRVLPRVFGDRRIASEEEKERVEQILPRVRAIYDSKMVDRLAEAVIDQSDAELSRMQPKAYARTWGADPNETLNTFLGATRAGLLRMRWDVICPHCRGDKQNLASLCEARERAFCASCNVDFDLDLGRSLEVVFSPHPQVRAIDEPSYCLGGPGLTPHIFFQRLLEPGEREAARIALPPGRYRARFTQEPTYRWIDVTAAPPGDSRNGAAFRIADGGLEGEDLTRSAGAPIELALENASSRRVLAAIESVAWADDALSGGELIADQRFRDLFSGELLAPGVKLGVESATILFTDLVGSTAMYEHLGDASAFRLVWTHFDALRQIVAEHRGAIVKTIGDAIMAVFMRPDDALAAADALHRTVAGFCRGKGHEYPVTLKIGMHEGPCIGVTLNDRLDYFGSTVNLAARVEAQSRGGDILISLAMAHRTGDAALLRESGWISEPLAAHCKGFREPIPMLRFLRS